MHLGSMLYEKGKNGGMLVVRLQQLTRPGPVKGSTMSKMLVSPEYMCAYHSHEKEALPLPWPSPIKSWESSHHCLNL